MIERSAARSVVQVLDWAFGTDVTPYSPALVDVAIRGSTFEQVLVLVDGVRVRDGQTGHFNLNLAIPLEQVERIEVLRGPAAALYGSDAMAGVINIVTRSADRSPGSVNVAAGSFALRSISAGHTLRLSSSAGIDVGASIERGDGHRSGTDFENMMGRISADMKLAGAPVRGGLSYARRAFGADGFYGEYPAFETTRTTSANLQSDLALASGISIRPSVWWRRNTDDFILYRDDPARYRNRHASNQAGVDFVTLTDRPGVGSVAFGLHAYRDQIRSRALGDHAEAVSAASVELATSPAIPVRATLGLRAERAPSGELLLAPAASFGWSPHTRVALRSSFGRAHRLPTWTERFYRDPIHQGSADLTGEQAWSIDGGLDLYLLPGFKVSAAAFIRDEHDLIDWARPADDSDPVWRTRNVDRATFRGVEAQLDLPEVAGTRVRGQGSWLSVSSVSGDGFLSKYALRPQVERVALLTDHSMGRWLDLSMRGARERRAGEQAHYRVDSRVSTRLGAARIHLDVTNLTDARYLDVTGNAAPGRAVAVGLEFRR